MPEKIEDDAGELARAEDRFRAEGDEDGKGRGKKRALRGGRHPQGPDYYSFFVAPQEKLKSAGRKNWFCKNTCVVAELIFPNGRF